MEQKSIKAGLNHWFLIDPIHLDIAQPGRLPEILKEMQRRGIASTWSGRLEAKMNAEIAFVSGTGFYSPDLLEDATTLAISPPLVLHQAT